MTNEGLKTTLGFVLFGVAGLWAANTNEVGMPEFAIMMTIAVSGCALLLGSLARAGGRTLVDGIGALILAASAYLTFAGGGLGWTSAILALGAAGFAISVVLATMRRTT